MITRRSLAAGAVARGWLPAPLEDLGLHGVGEGGEQGALPVVRRAAGGGTVFAVLTGAATAAYTLWDKQAVGPHGLSPLVFYWGTNLVNTLCVTPWAATHRDAVRTAWRSRRAS